MNILSCSNDQIKPKASTIIQMAVTDNCGRLEKFLTRRAVSTQIFFVKVKSLLLHGHQIMAKVHA